MKTRYALLVVIVVLSLASIACGGVDDSQGWIEEFQEGSSKVKFGDGAGIGEKLQDTVCRSQGGTWDSYTDTCK